MMSTWMNEVIKTLFISWSLEGHFSPLSCPMSFLNSNILFVRLLLVKKENRCSQNISDWEVESTSYPPHDWLSHGIESFGSQAKKICKDREKLDKTSWKYIKWNWMQIEQSMWRKILFDWGLFWRHIEVFWCFCLVDQRECYSSGYVWGLWRQRWEFADPKVVDERCWSHKCWLKMSGWIVMVNKPSIKLV